MAVIPIISLVFAIIVVVVIFVIGVELIALFAEEAGYELPTWLRVWDMWNVLLFTVVIALFIQAILCLFAVIGAML